MHTSSFRVHTYLLNACYFHTYLISTSLPGSCKSRAPDHDLSVTHLQELKRSLNEQHPFIHSSTDLSSPLLPSPPLPSQSNSIQSPSYFTPQPYKPMSFPNLSFFLSCSVPFRCVVIDFTRMHIHTYVSSTFWRATVNPFCYVKKFRIAPGFLYS